MLDNINLEDILFLDIETAPQTYNYQELHETTKSLWDNKFKYLQNDTAENHYKKAGIFAEFAKVICISVGIIKGKSFRIKSFCCEEEATLLSDFAELLNKYYNRKNHLLCAHNGKEFDFPFIARRMLINGIKLPKILNIAGKKPWEINHLDTMDLWKFGDYKNYTSLNLLAHVFNIPTPKDDIEGGEVARVYWEEKDIPRITNYCQKDVLTVAQLLLRFRGEPLITQENIIL
jgi:DNA polymerase elongation subunit (family B)